MLGKLRVTLALVLGASSALANVAAQEQPGAPAGNVGARGGVAITVTSETLEIRCVERDDVPVCTFSAIYALENRRPTPVTALAAFWGNAADVTLAVDGRAGRVFSNEERASVAVALTSIEKPPEGLEQPTSAGIDLALAPGQRATLVARGTLDLGWAGGRGYELEPVHARHHLLQPSAPRSTTLTASYYLSPIRSFLTAGPIRVVLSIPSHWDPTLRLETTDGSLEPVQLAADGSATLAPERARMLYLAFDHTTSFHPGGPFFGIGGAFGEHGGFRLRGGYELAAPSWLFWSLTAETDASELFTVTPLVEAATDQILIIPSLGFGLGVPVRLEPERAVGARAQATLGIYKLGVAGSLDWFPKGAGGQSETTFSLLAYVWL